MLIQKCSLGQYSLQDIQEVRVIPTSPEEFPTEGSVRRYLEHTLPRLDGRYEYESRGIRLKPFPHNTLALVQWNGALAAYGILWGSGSGYYRFDPRSIRSIAPVTSEELRRIDVDPGFQGLCQSKLYLCGSKETLDRRRLRRLILLLKRKRSAYLRDTFH